MISPELQEVAKRYTGGNELPDAETRIRDAQMLRTAGYAVQRAFTSSTFVVENNPIIGDATSLKTELESWQNKSEGVAGPYVQFSETGEVVFLPKIAIAYWQQLEASE